MCYKCYNTSKMQFLKNLLGITKLENQIKQNQSKIKLLQKNQSKIKTNSSQITKNKSQIKTQKSSLQNLEDTFTKTNREELLKSKALKLLTTPKSTTQIARHLNVGRSYASRILNQLEKQGKITEHSRKGKTILYKKY